MMMIPLVVAALGCMSLQGEGYAKVRAPEFLGGPDRWINSAPLKMKGLRGKVVLVDIWEYTCVNCIRTFPYLKEWWERYKDKGLLIVGIHTPEFAFAKQDANVRQAVKDFGFTFPVLLDPDYKNWNAYANSYWPRKYLVDKDGYIVYDHAGEGGYGDMEAKIQEQLRRLNPKVELPPLMEPVRESDKPGAVCYPITPEMYAGSRGYGSQFAQGPFREGETVEYKIPAELQEGVFYMGGVWTPMEDHLAARGKGSALAIRYKAKEANAVLRRSGEPLEVEVLQDGSPVASADMGRDLRAQNGRTIFTLDKPRMYSLTANAKWGIHNLELRPLGPGFQIFSFAFSSDCDSGE